LGREMVADLVLVVGKYGIPRHDEIELVLVIG
jgi:hypothetical protein